MLTKVKLATLSDLETQKQPVDTSDVSFVGAFNPPETGVVAKIKGAVADWVRPESPGKKPSPVKEAAKEAGYFPELVTHGASIITGGGKTSVGRAFRSPLVRRASAALVVAQITKGIFEGQLAIEDAITQGVGAESGLFPEQLEQAFSKTGKTPTWHRFTMADKTSVFHQMARRNPKEMSATKIHVPGTNIWKKMTRVEADEHLQNWMESQIRPTIRQVWGQAPGAMLREIVRQHKHPIKELKEGHWGFLAVDVGLALGLYKGTSLIKAMVENSISIKPISTAGAGAAGRAGAEALAEDISKYGVKFPTAEQRIREATIEGKIPRVPPEPRAPVWSAEEKLREAGKKAVAEYPGSMVLRKDRGLSPNRPINEPSSAKAELFEAAERGKPKVLSPEIPIRPTRGALPAKTPEHFGHDFTYDPTKPNQLTIYNQRYELVPTFETIPAGKTLNQEMRMPQIDEKDLLRWFQSAEIKVFNDGTMAWKIKGQPGVNVIPKAGIKKIAEELKIPALQEKLEQLSRMEWLGTEQLAHQGSINPDIKSAWIAIEKDLENSIKEYYKIRGAQIEVLPEPKLVKPKRYLEKKHGKKKEPDKE